MVGVPQLLDPIISDQKPSNISSPPLTYDAFCFTLITIFCVPVFWSLAMPDVVNVENEVEVVDRGTTQMLSAVVGAVMG